MAAIGDRVEIKGLEGKVIGKEYESEPHPLKEGDKLFFTILTIEDVEGKVTTVKIRHTPGG